MAEYIVALKRSAEKELERLPGDVIGRMVAKLEQLALDPRPSGCVMLQGGDREYQCAWGSIAPCM